MFEGEKTIVFWIGLIILAFASTFLFQTLWLLVFQYCGVTLGGQVPIIVKGVVFILIGLYMMKSGVREKPQG